MNGRIERHKGTTNNNSSSDPFVPFAPLVFCSFYSSSPHPFVPLVAGHRKRNKRVSKPPQPWGGGGDHNKGTQGTKHTKGTKKTKKARDTFVLVFLLSPEGLRVGSGSFSFLLFPMLGSTTGTRTNNKAPGPPRSRDPFVPRVRFIPFVCPPPGDEERFGDPFVPYVS